MTIRPISDILALFNDGQPRGSITPDRVRDAVESLDKTADIAVLEDALASLSATTLALSYIKNWVANGNMTSAPSWTYTGTSPIVSLTGLTELTKHGLVKAYSIPITGGIASQVRINTGNLAAIGLVPTDNILLGAFYYASDGASWPAGSVFASFTIKVNGVTQSMDSTGFVQISTNVRFYWAKKVIPEGVLSEIIIGWNSGSLPAVGAGIVRYHTGIFIGKASVDPVDTPTLATIRKYEGWLQETGIIPPEGSSTGSGEVINPSANGILNLGGAGLESSIEVTRGGKKIKRAFKPYPNLSLTASSVFNFTSDYINDLALRVTTDEPAPYRTMGTTLGANHGYQMTTVTANAHGKSQVDVGSVWSDGAAQHIIIGIKDANNLYMTNRGATNGNVPLATFTFVSGAVGSHSANIVATAVATGLQFYPPFQNRKMRCLVDDIEIDITVTGAMKYYNKVAFQEYYELLDKASISTWYEANGSSGSIQPSSLVPAVAVSISYSFDVEGNCTIYSDFLVLKNGIALQDIMFIQAGRINTDGPVKYYIPKALPVTQDGHNYDYANIDDTDTSFWTGRLDFTPARCVAGPGILCDRVIQLNDNAGFVLGYLPLRDADVVTRRTQATVKALQISDSSAKVYMSAIDKGNLTLNTGDFFSVIAYRNVLVRTSDRTAFYAVRTNRGDDYLYFDWHRVTVDHIQIPSDYVGRDFVVVEKSANVTVRSGTLNNTFTVETTSATYAYLILKVT